MIFRQSWTGRIDGDKTEFPASVPGNIQKDYADFMGWDDINFGENSRMYLPLEENAWIYKAELEYKKKSGEKVFFVSNGIDYKFDIIVNGKVVFSQEGMFKKVEVDITDNLNDSDNTLEVYIYPHPKRKDADKYTRREADECCKPPVSYGWDWHPRVIPSGIWNDAYIETRNSEYLSDCEIIYHLSDDLKSVEVNFVSKRKKGVTYELYSPVGDCIYSGSKSKITIENPMLWWCNGHGEQNMYTWRMFNNSCEKKGKVGFRKIELVNNYDYTPKTFPMTRNLPPITICLNGREIFAKGSNWVNPEIFIGTITRDTYYPLVKYAKDANMNIFRCWGGAGCNKEEFYTLCDEMGILVWQEFPLACNNYKNIPHYLEVLESEGRAIVKTLRKHPSMAIWCGGNELFNTWSGMTDQSYALRLLNKICYEEDVSTPFIPTSPIYGMSHGWYMFDTREKDNIVYQVFNKSYSTTYTEFGVPSISPADYLKTFIPEDELYPPKPEGSWKLHHGFEAWDDNDESTWACIPMLDSYFGESSSIEELCEKSAWTQCEGYKAIFEESRRQKPHCSMSVNWCYNEPWKTAANNSIINYPAFPKPAYYAVRDALRPVMPSARLQKFEYNSGEVMSVELWLLNDSPEKVSDVVEAYLDFDGEKVPLAVWETGESEENRNIKGKNIKITLPEFETDRFTVVLKTKKYGESRYLLRYNNIG